MGHDHGDPRGDLGVILKVVYVILMTEMVVRGDSYEKCCWKCFKNHIETTDLSLGNHTGDPRGDLRVILRVI